MPIASTDILLKLSVKTGAAGNSLAGTPDGSLGKYISTTQVADATLHNLFDLVTGAENAASESEYRCVFVHNANASIVFQNVKVYLSAEVAGGAVTAVGVDPTAASAIGATAAQALEVVDENTAPTEVAFSSPTTLAAGISLGDIGPGQCRAFWVRRTTANSAAQANDGVTLRIQGESL